MCDTKLALFPLRIFWKGRVWAVIAKKGKRSYGSQLKNCHYYFTSSVSGQDETNPVLWLATRAVRMEPSWPLGIARCVPTRETLFSSVVAHQIRITDSIKGLENGNKITKLSLYADDTTAFIRDDSSAASLFALLFQFRVFSNLSGLKINRSKTEGLWLGRWKSRLGKDEPFGISWPKRMSLHLEYVSLIARMLESN